MRMMEARSDRHLSPLGLAAVGAGFCAGLAVLTAATVRMAAPANVAAASDFGPADAQRKSENSIDNMCTSILKGRADLMAQCRDEEQMALQYVTSYLQTNGLLADDGSIDNLALAEAVSGPLGVTDSDPATITAYCLQNSSDWISAQECINSLDSDAAYEGLAPAGRP